MSRALPLVALLVAVAVLATGVGVPALVDAVEGAHASAAAGAAADPGFRRADGPPLWIFAAAGSIRTLGPSEAAVRLPSLLAAIACAVAVLRTGAFAFGAQTGALATVMLATMPICAVAARLAFPDAAVGALAFGALAAAFGALASETEGRPHHVATPVFWICAGGALLAGGPAGLAIPLFGIVLYALIARDRTAIRAVRDPIGLALFVALAVGGAFFGAWRVPTEGAPGWQWAVAWLALLAPWGLIYAWPAIARGRLAADPKAGGPLARRARVFFACAFASAGLAAMLVPRQTVACAVAAAPALALLFADGAAAVKKGRLLGAGMLAGAVAVALAAAVATFGMIAPDLVPRGMTGVPRSYPVALLPATAGALAAAAAGLAVGGVLARSGRPDVAPLPLAGGLAAALALLPLAVAGAIEEASPRAAVEAARRSLGPTDAVVTITRPPASVPFYLGMMPQRFDPANRDSKDALEVRWRGPRRAVAILEGKASLEGFLKVVGDRRVEGWVEAGRFIVVENMPPPEPSIGAPPPR